MTHSDTVVFRNVMIPMRDGTKLSTDLFFPSFDGKSPAPGKFPVLMSRTWYNKAENGIPPLPDFLATNGYVVAIQDVRGRYASPGKDMPWLNDGLGQNQDGYDTAAWLERQPWSTGKLGIFGNSYLGGSAWGAVISQPPSLAVAVIDEPASDNYQNMVYLNGALMLHTAGGWTWGAVMGSSALTDAQRASLAKIHEQGADPRTMKTSAVASGFGWANIDFFKHLPLREMPLNKDEPWWEMWMDAWEKPWVFDFTSTFDRLHEVKAPILHRAGWYSLFLPATLAQYKGASTRP
ncbi:MAG: CocE/NonD family hydrolase, partial [Agrobacterium vaccinii]